MSQQYRYPNSASVTVAAVGANGAPIPTQSILIGAENPSGNLAPLITDPDGALLVDIDNVNPASIFKVDVEQLLGAAPSATNPLAIRLSNGAAYYQGATETSNLAIEGFVESIDAKTPALGQAAMAASVPVAIASNQSAVPVSAASLPLPSGAATEATLLSFSNKSIGSDIVVKYDYRSFTYVGSTQQIDTIVYKTGGSGGTTVATQTFGYDGSARISSITTT